MDGMHSQDFAVELRLQLSDDAPPRVADDIAAYNALVALQSTMTGASSWYQRLS